MALQHVPYPDFPPMATGEPWPYIDSNSVAYLYPGLRTHQNPARTKITQIAIGSPLWTGVLEIRRIGVAGIDTANQGRRIAQFFRQMGIQEGWTDLPLHRDALPLPSTGAPITGSAIVSGRLVHYVSATTELTRLANQQALGGSYDQWITDRRRTFNLAAPITLSQGQIAIDMIPQVRLSNSTRIYPATTIRAYAAAAEPVLDSFTGEGSGPWVWPWVEYLE